MTIKTEYIPIILVPNILCHYFHASFLLQTLKSTAAYSVIFDLNNGVKLTIQKLASQPSYSPKNRIPFNPILFLRLCTPWTVYKLFNSISV